MEFSFAGGAAQDPKGKAGAGAHARRHARRGRGRSRLEAFHRALDDHAIRLQFQRRARRIQRPSADADAQSRQGLRTDGAGAERAALRRRAAGARARPDQRRAQARIARTPIPWRRRPGGAPPGPTIPMRAPRAANWAKSTRSTRDDLVALREQAAGARRAEGRRGRRHRRRRRWRAISTPCSPACRQRPRATPVPKIDVAGLGRRVVVDLDVPQANIRFGRPGLDAPAIPITLPRWWSTTSWAAAPSPRGCGRRSAKSAA